MSVTLAFVESFLSPPFHSLPLSSLRNLFVKDNGLNNCNLSVMVTIKTHIRSAVQWCMTLTDMGFTEKSATTELFI